MFGEDELIKVHRRRAQALSNIILICFSVVFARLWYLQVYRGKTLYEFSLQNRLRKELVKAPRGMVFSRNNHLLIDNIPRFDAILIPQYLKDKEKTLIRLSKILDMPLSTIKKILQKYKSLAKYKPIIIKKNISRKEVSLIETEGSYMPGISVDTFISRQYLDGDIGAHLFGYISEINQDQLPRYRRRDKVQYNLGDYIGQFGLEERMDLILRGINGHEFVEVDALGRRKKNILTDNILKGTIRNLSAVPGKNIRLSIDRDLQHAAYKALEGKTGGAVAVDVNNGEILAMVSRPSFNPSLFSLGLTNEYWNSLINNPLKPLRDKTLQEHYPPGSTFKIITLAAALEEGIVDEKTLFKCKGKLRLGKRPYHCWKGWGHGQVNAVKAIRESCDVYFYQIAKKLDIDVLAKYARMFGLGSRTGINLPSEASGLIPTKEWKLKKNGQGWQKGETLSCAIGQSYMLATPLQLAMAYAALANGGTLFRPILVKEVFSNSGEVTVKNNPQERFKLGLSKSTLDILKRGLFQVANHPKGTVWWRRGVGLNMSGKTGTSQVKRVSVDKLFAKCSEFEYKFRHHGLFVGYAPTDKPEIAVSTIVEHGCSGGKTAAPVVTEVLTAYMKKYRPKLHAALSKKQVEEFKLWLKKRKEQQETREKENQDNSSA